MPTNSNSVYQPTTVTNTFIAQTSNTSRTNYLLQKPWMKILLLISGLLFLAVGIIIFSLGTVDYEDSQYAPHEIPNERKFDTVLIVLGIFFAILGVVLLGNVEKMVLTNDS